MIEKSKQDTDTDDSLIGKLKSLNNTMTGPITHNGKRRIYEERFLPVNSDVYVLGEAKPKSDNTQINKDVMNDGQEDLLEIHPDESTETFLIFDGYEEDRMGFYKITHP